MKTNTLLTTLAVVGLAVAAQATPVTFDFQQFGNNVNLGTSKTFSSGSASISAYGFASSGGLATDLFAKYTLGDPGETGLGIVSDPTGNTEIWGTTFVQLHSAIGLPTINISFGSTTAGEVAEIYYSTTLGVLGTLLTTFTAGGSYDIAADKQLGYISLKAGGSTGSGVPNVLLTGATVNTPTAPDGGSTIMLMGAALTAAGMIRRKLVA